MKGQACENCRFWRKIVPYGQPHKTGSCCRRAISAGWGTTDHDAWCGEWEAEGLPDVRGARVRLWHRTDVTSDGSAPVWAQACSEGEQFDVWGYGRFLRWLGDKDGSAAVAVGNRVYTVWAEVMEWVEEPER